MTEFNGVILNEVRDAFGYSRKDLAEKLDVSEQSIWQFERGFANPSGETLSKLEEIFMVTRPFFFSELKNNPRVIGFSQVVDEKRVAYRSKVKSKSKKVSREQAYLNIVHDSIQEIISGIAAMPNELTRLRHEVRSMRLDGANMNHIALYVRNEIGVSANNRDLIPALERSGAYIVERGMDQDVDAYSTWTDDEMPLIVLGSTKQVAVRRNMDAAHEAGHLVLHYGWDLSDDTSTEYSLAEKEANEFAAAFTLPYDTFPTVFRRMVKDPTNPYEYLEIKKYYNISMQAIEYRAMKLNLITKQQSGYFWGRLKKNKLDVMEPLDKEIRIVAPGKLRALLKFRSDNHMLRITDILKIKPNFLTVFGFDKKFIKSLKLDSKHMYKNSNNIVNLFGNFNLEEM